jgi:hypothetical protein
MRFQASHQPSNLSVKMHLQSRVAVCWILVFLSFLISILALGAGTKPNFLPNASLVDVTLSSPSKEFRRLRRTPDHRPPKRPIPKCLPTPIQHRLRQSAHRQHLPMGSHLLPLGLPRQLHHRWCQDRNILLQEPFSRNPL